MATTPESWIRSTPADVTDALRFTSTELRVIALGEKADVIREHRLDGRLGRAVRWLTGLSAARPLADPRLEALRRFASKARHRGAELKGEDVEALVTAGYTAGQAWGLAGYLAGPPRSGARA